MTLHIVVSLFSCNFNTGGMALAICGFSIQGFEYLRAQTLVKMRG